MNTNLIALLVQALSAVLTITLHQYIKALTSTMLGDPLPKNTGRLTLNPKKHLEPIGCILMLIFGIGWGKPMETSPIYYKSRKTGTLLTCLLPFFVLLCVGILMGILLGCFCFRYLDILSSLYTYPISFALFSLIPVYPMEGARVLSQFLSPRAVTKMSAYDNYLRLIVIFLILTGYLPGLIGILTDMVYRHSVYPVVRWFLI